MLAPSVTTGAVKAPTAAELNRIYEMSLPEWVQGLSAPIVAYADQIGGRILTPVGIRALCVVTCRPDGSGARHANSAKPHFTEHHLPSR
jgi:hypothetical protein